MQQKLFICLILFVASAPAFSQRVRVQIIPDVGSANDMSPDGRFVVGSKLSGGTFVLDRMSNTMTTLPEEGNSAAAVSDDGQTVIGNMDDPDGGQDVAGIWKTSTGMWQSLGTLPGVGATCGGQSSGYEISADGSIAVGLAFRDGCSARGFRWTEADGLKELQPLANGGNRASVVSADGNVIGGFAQGSFSRTPAVWDGATLLGELLDPPNGDVVGEVHGIRDDGSIMLGTWESDATTWTDDNGSWVRSTIDDGSFRPGWTGIPLDIADNDTVIGFDLLFTNRAGWIQPDGSGPIQGLEQWVQAHGAEIPFYDDPFDPNDPPRQFRLSLDIPRAISADGSYIIGNSFFQPSWQVEITSNCDLDFDTDCDLDDIDSLVEAIATSSTDLLFDVNGDGSVDLADRDRWLADAGAENLDSGAAFLVADANLDGAVDLSDLHHWNENRMTATAAWSLGDFNADGISDVADFDLWNGNRFQSSGSLVSVPEPAGHCILVIGGWACLYWRGRRWQREIGTSQNCRMPNLPRT